VEPTSNAAYVRFETLNDSERMPGLSTGSLPWLYVEGLRLDEAMNGLSILATGVYGKPLPPQNGAPVGNNLCLLKEKTYSDREEQEEGAHHNKEKRIVNESQQDHEHTEHANTGATEKV